jgi:thioesterase domain-containing protein/acyl carrier protein
VTGQADAIEQQLTQIMGEVLGFGAIEPHEDFFDLGGDSIQAVELLSLIERRMKLKIPFHVLAQSSTVAHLAKIARNGLDVQPWSPLVELQPGSKSHPLFLAAPSGGNVFCYRQLIDHLQTDRAVFGLQAPGIDGSRPLMSSVEEMAECYLAEVMRLQPHGPYYLGGWSYGALVAYEMAVRLTAQQEPVALLLVIDSAIRYSFRMVDSVVAEKGMGICGMLRMPFEEQVRVFQAKTRGTQIFPPNAAAELCRGIYRVCIQNIRASLEYRPRPFPGKLVLLEAEEKLARTRVTAEEEWQPLCQEVVRHLVPGNHFNVISPPNVEHPARILRSYLDTSPSHAASSAAQTREGTRGTSFQDPVAQGARRTVSARGS